MEVRVEFIVVYKPPHGKVASRHETLEFERSVTLGEMLYQVGRKSQEFCHHHGYELERYSVKSVS